MIGTDARLDPKPAHLREFRVSIQRFRMERSAYLNHRISTPSWGLRAVRVTLASESAAAPLCRGFR